MRDADDVAADWDLAAVRLLDPAHPRRPSAGRGGAAQDMLARITAERSLSAAEETAAPPSSARRATPRRWLAMGATAAALALGLAVWQPRGGAQPAFATWTPEPEPVAAASVAALVPECAAGAADGVDGEPSPERNVVLTEERGRVTFLVSLRGGRVENCLLVDGRFSSAGSAGGLGMPTPAPEEASAVMIVGGGRGETAYTAAVGRVGDGVVGVDVHPAGAVHDPGTLPGGVLPDTVEATVMNGYFGAWWPGVGGDQEATLTLRLADGTVVRGVPAFAG